MVFARSLWVSMMLVVAGLAAPGRAVAAPAPAAAPKSTEAAGRAHFQRGQKATNAGDYATAYREFEAGYAATGRPLFLFNMAEAARAQGDADKARDAYRAFLRADPDSALAATARTRLAELDPAPPPAAPPPQAPPVLLPPSSVAPAPMTSAGQPLPSAPAAHDDAPLYKKWPFWAVVGAVVVAGGVTAYAVEHHAGSTPTETCVAPGCTPIVFK